MPPNMHHYYQNWEFMESTLSGFVKGVGDTVGSAAAAVSAAVDASPAAAKTSAEKAGHSALELGKSTDKDVGDAAQAPSSVASKARNAVSRSATKLLAAVKHSIRMNFSMNPVWVLSDV
ncbi:hypothetical protein [Massilia aquatica]|uniref:Uncharacterized protein n=1 Tax=Massilia aquatica TaxID=2609000 RepID=A0ABX0M5I6_9BURK|nr:hypothetical protein [Massilia aquatica]NHZ42491.1 hypothetical protein [Massilia aquatica]